MSPARALPSPDLRRALFVAIGVMAAALVGPLFGSHFFGLDLHRHDFPLLCELGDQVAQGTGLWLSEHRGKGAPLWADPAAQVLYPLRWLQLLIAAVLGSDAAHDVGIAGHLALAAAGAYLLARSFRLRPPWAAVAGLTFATSGTVVNLLLHGFYLVGAAWLPFAWWLGRRALASGRRAPPLALVVVLVLLLLGGEVQAFSWVALTLAAESLLVGRGLGWPERARRALPVLGAGVLASVLCAPLYLPAWLEASLTSRSGGFDLEEQLKWSVDAASLFATVFPIDLLWPFLGGPPLEVAIGSGAEWNATPHLGLLVVVAAVLGLRWRRMRSAAGVFAFAGLASLGGATPFYPLVIGHLPVLSSFRYPEKYLVWWTLAAILLAAAGGQTLLVRRSRRWVVGAAAIGAAGAGLAFVLVRGRVAPTLIDALDDGAWMVLLFAVATLILASRRPLRRFLPAAFVLSTAVPAASFVQLGPSVRDVPLAVDPAPPEGAVLCHDESALAEAMFTGEQTYWYLFLAQWALGAPELGACHGFTQGASYSALTTRVEAGLERTARLGPGNARAEEAARALGCTHWLVGPSDERNAGDAGPNLRGRLVPVPAPLPEAGALVDPAPTPDLLEAYLQGAPFLPAVDVPGGALPDPLPHGTLDVEVSWQAPHEGQLRPLGDEPAVVFTRRSYRRGWTARQGERELPVVRVAGNLLGVVVDDPRAGNLELRYRPPGLAPAFLLAGLALLALVGWGLLARRRPASSTAGGPGRPA